MVPWALQLLFFTLLYATFPRDRDASVELERQRRLAMVAGPTSNLLQASGAALTCQHFAGTKEAPVRRRAETALHVQAGSYTAHQAAPLGHMDSQPHMGVGSSRRGRLTGFCLTCDGYVYCRWYCTPLVVPSPHCYQFCNSCIADHPWIGVPLLTYTETYMRELVYPECNESLDDRWCYNYCQTSQLFSS